jgi:hypothetical protein
MKRPWRVSTDTACRRFPTFVTAERWARHEVAKSARNEFSIRAAIHGPGCDAEVRLDGCDRVWTDIKREWMP